MKKETTNTRQILVKQEGEEKPETVYKAAHSYVNSPNKSNIDSAYHGFIAGSNWQSSQQSKRIAELEGALREVRNKCQGMILDKSWVEFIDKALKGAANEKI